MAYHNLCGYVFREESIQAAIVPFSSPGTCFLKQGRLSKLPSTTSRWLHTAHVFETGDSGCGMHCHVLLTCQRMRLMGELWWWCAMIRTGTHILTRPRPNMLL
jgi:hypothetical protein